MSYEVTATRRRPQQFDDLVDQEFVAETLKKSIKSGKIAHAYLFSGPRGCGKTSTARILAKALNCQNGPTDTPCGQCSNCDEITKGTSLDVIEIDGASNTSVENIRQIKDEVLFPPSNSKYKIYIIDEVHMLSTSAFNALLKTIEEPPPYVIFIFATTELQKVPATIKSRCQQFNFRLVAIDKVKQCLAEAAAELGIQADDEALFWVARESTGSMRDAYTLFDQVVAFSDGHITYEKIRDKLGLVGIDRLNTIFEACAQNKSGEVLNLLDDFLQNGVSIEQLISNCADYLRSLLLIKNNVKKESLLGNAPERFSNIVLNTWNTVQVERALSIFFQLYRDIRYSLSPRYELELTFSRLCWLNQYVSNTEVKKAIDAAKALLGNAPVNQNNVTQQQNNVQHIQNTVQNTQNIPVQSSVEAAFNKPVTPINNQENHVPNGLPRLSMLDNISNEQNNQTDFNTETDSDPFHNGGPLPPEQSVADTNVPESVDTADNSTTEHPAVIDERLRINIPQANIINGDVVPTVEVPESETGYTLNPDEDIPDDGWSNMDEPPEDDYYPDDSELAEEATQMENTYENPSVELAPATQINNIQTETFITTAEGKQVSIAQLKGTVIAELSVKDGFAASAIEKTGEWKITQTSIETTVSNAYDLALIKKKSDVVSSHISNICGKQLTFNVSLESVSNNDKTSGGKIPSQVNMLVNAFKGTIVAGKV